MKENDDYKTEILYWFPFMTKKHSTFVLDLKNEETFVDSFGNQPSFTDWHSGQPDNYNDEEDYVLYQMGHGKWSDIKGSNEYMWIENLHTICQLICY